MFFRVNWNVRQLLVHGCFYYFRTTQAGIGRAENSFWDGAGVCSEISP